VPVRVACLVPAAPALLPALTGPDLPEVAPVRAAVTHALEHLVGLDLVVVVAPHVTGTLAGFGAPDPESAADRDGTAAPDGAGRWDGSTRDDPVQPSWPHELAAELLATVPGVPAERLRWSWDDLAPQGDQRPGDLQALPGAVGVLLLADGSRTRGLRAPGGDDPRGAVVDAELLAALREARSPTVPDAAAVGATAGPAIRLLSLLGDAGSTTEVLYADAPLGVGYLVAVRRLPGPVRGDR
jgi:hypothetical protein